jgi:hypothetical protein
MPIESVQGKRSLPRGAQQGKTGKRLSPSPEDKDDFITHMNRRQVSLVLGIQADRILPLMLTEHGYPALPFPKSADVQWILLPYTFCVGPKSIFPNVEALRGENLALRPGPEENRGARAGHGGCKVDQMIDHLGGLLVRAYEGCGLPRV